MYVRTASVLASAMGLAGCLYSGDGTMGLPCNTDVECGGTQQCVMHVCGGPTEQGSTSMGSGESSGSSDGTATSAGDDFGREQCDESDDVCLPDMVLRKCSGGKLETQGCQGICGESSPALECGESAKDGLPTCYCKNEREACDAADKDSFHCTDSAGLVECDGKFWVPNDCDAVCKNAGYAGADYCGAGDTGDTCFCNESCVDNAHYCVGNDVTYCSSGSWTTYDCDQLCVDSGFTRSVGCDYFAGDGESCACV